MFRIPQIYSISELALGGKLNRVNDPVAGGSIPAGSVVPGGGAVNSQNLRAGQVGFAVEIDTDEALRLSDTAVGTLFAGWYMYVQSLTTSVRGCAAFISSLANGGIYAVTGDSSVAANLLKPVGVFINPITANQFGWIQIAGLASLQFVTAITNEADGAPVKIVDQAGTGRGEILNTDFSAPTIATLGPYMRSGMVAAELPVDNTVTRVWLRPCGFLV